MKHSVFEVCLSVFALCYPSVYGLTCLHCEDVPQPRHCHTVTNCETDEVCLAERSVTTHLYRLGCVNQNLIKFLSHGSTRNDTVCTAFCDSNLCNAQACGEPGYPATRGPVCYNCNYHTEQHPCNTIDICSTDEECRIISKDEFGDTILTSGCKSRHDCQDPVMDPSVIVGRRTVREKRSSSHIVCDRCCSGDLCNFNCSGDSYPGNGYDLPNATKPAAVGHLTDKCVYQSRLYDQGDKWNDGCDYSCECLDGRTGYYQCKPLCPVYNNLPTNLCYLVKAQGVCCAQAMCYDSSVGRAVNPLTSTTVIPVVGTFSGAFRGFRPGYPYSGFTGVTGSNNISDVCVYNGTVYHKGDEWDDGCDLSCTCIDDVTSQFKCDIKCPTYTKIPPSCSVRTVPGDCCRTIECQKATVATSTTTTTTRLPIGNCIDRITDCQGYGQSVCNNTVYQSWAARYCPAYCHICKPDNITTAPPCQDQHANCDLYTQAVCSSYEPWAKDNCQQYCGFCISQVV